MNNEYSIIYKRWTRFLKENNRFVYYVTKYCISYTTIYNLQSIFYIKNGLRDNSSSSNDTESFCYDLPWWARNIFLEFEESNKKFLRKNQHIEGRNAIWGGIMNHGTSKAIKIM